MSDVTVTLHTEATFRKSELVDYLRQLRQAGWPMRVIQDFVNTGTGVWESQDGLGRLKVSKITMRDEVS